MKQTILIVEDEVKLADVLSKYLEADGYATQYIADGSEAIAAIKQYQPVLVLLDIMLPGKNGIEICKEVRQFSNLPIIMTTAKVEEIDRLLGLEIGADDYICKPYSPREVVARVKACLRRVAFAEADDKQSSVSLGLELDYHAYQAKLDQHNLDLTPVEFRILVALTTQPISVYSRAQLMDKMYQDHRAVSDRTVDSHVANLRKKLKQVRADSECIESIYGVGYRYIID